MTLSLNTLSEWRRMEQDRPDLIIPPKLADIKALLDQLMQEAGPDPLTWPADCEVFAAREMLDDIFRIRRGKLARFAEHNPNEATTPMPRQMYDFEGCAWAGLTEKYRHLDKAVKEAIRDGTWELKQWGKS